jgi:hypothetical protein
MELYNIIGSYLSGHTFWVRYAVLKDMPKEAI